MKVLIVDDSAMMRRTVQRHVNQLEVEIIGAASNGNEAIELVKSHQPDIVTLDITMPGMDGLSCLDHIMEIAPETKVIVVTALKDKPTGLKALKKGAVGYINKPIDEDDIVSAFDDVLNMEEDEY
ncbi:MAG: response regulator [Cyclobacteriaceae bacterium]